MNEMIMKLNALVDESLNLINNVKEETVRLKNIDLKNKIEKHDDFCNHMKSYFDIAFKLGNFSKSIKVSEKYQIKFGYPAKRILVFNLKNLRIGYLDVRDQYSSNYNKFIECKDKNNNLISKLDVFLDTFDWELFDNNFAIAISERLAEEAEKANIDYQIIKEKVNE